MKPISTLIFVTFGLSYASSATASTPIFERQQYAAVLSFDVHSPNPDHAWFGPAMAESLTTRLAAVPALALVERRRLNDLLLAKGVGQTGEFDEKRSKQALEILGVEYLLIGSVQVANQRRQIADIRIDARIVKTETAEIQGELAFSVTGSTSDLFALQSEIAVKFVDVLGIKVTDDEKNALQESEARNAQAYRVFQEANTLLDERSYRKAIDRYDEAMRLNRGFFDAAHRNQGTAYVRLARASQGVKRSRVQLEHIEKFERDARATSPALFDLGLAYKAAIRWHKAYKAFRNYLSFSVKTVLWSQPTHKSLVVPPFFYRDNLLVVDENGVEIQNLADGKILHKLRFSGLKAALLARSAEQLFVSDGESIAALSLPKLTVVWETSLPKLHAVRRVSIAKTTTQVFLLQSDYPNSQVHGLSRHSGQLQWSRLVQGSTKGLHASNDQKALRVLHFASTSRVFGANAEMHSTVCTTHRVEDGRETARVVVDGDFEGTVIHHADQEAIVENYRGVGSLALKDGTVNWSVSVRDAASVWAPDERALYTVMEGMIVKFDPVAGREIWRSEESAISGKSRPIINDAMVIVPTDSALVLLDKYAGETIKRIGSKREGHIAATNELIATGTRLIDVGSDESRSPVSRYNAHLQLAEVALSMGKAQTAVLHAADAISLFPLRAGGYLLLSRAKQVLGAGEEALENIVRYAVRLPTNEANDPEGAVAQALAKIGDIQFHRISPGENTIFGNSGERYVAWRSCSGRWQAGVCHLGLLDLEAWDTRLALKTKEVSDVWMAPDGTTLFKSADRLFCLTDLIAAKQRLWKLDDFAGPLLLIDNLVVGRFDLSDRGKVKDVIVGIDLHTGKQVYEMHTGIEEEVRFFFKADNQLALVHGIRGVESDSHLMLADLDTGKRNSGFKLSGGDIEWATVLGEQLYLVNEKHVLYRLVHGARKETKMHTFDGFIRNGRYENTNATCQSDLCLIGDDQGLYSLMNSKLKLLASGKVLWLTRHDDEAYALVSGLLIAIDLSTGRQRWKQPAGGRKVVAGSGGVAVIDAHGNSLSLFDSTGRPKKTVGGLGRVDSCQFTDDRLLVGTEYGVFGMEVN